MKWQQFSRWVITLGMNLPLALVLLLLLSSTPIPLYAFTIASLFTSQVAKLTASDGAAKDRFGYAVAISEDIAVVGVPWDDDACPLDPNCNSGVAYVFERNQGGADNWGQVTKLTHSTLAANDYFGWAVAISGDIIGVGTPGDDDACSPGSDCNSGAVYIFKRDQGGANSWGQVTKLTGSEATDDGLGFSVAISEYTVLAGALTSDNYKGAAYVFERNQGGPDNWGQVARLTAGDPIPDDGFGYSVTISGDIAVVGAPVDNNYTGAAYVFERNRGGVDNWGQVTKLTGSDAALNDTLGFSVAISGETVVAGAPFKNKGLAYIFERNQGGVDKWGQVTKLTTSNATVGEFGWSVAINEDTVIIGARFDHEGGTASGAAYIFERNQDGIGHWGQAAKLTANDPATYDHFGYSVTISEDTVVVGAPGDGNVSNLPGSAYVYQLLPKIYLPIIFKG